LHTPTIMEMEECVGKNEDVLKSFLETDEGKKIKSSVKSIRALVSDLKSSGYENLPLLNSIVNLLYTLIENTPEFGRWLGSRSSQLQDPTELVAYNLAYLIYKKINIAGQTK
jgi:hypothetical protein